MSELVNCVLLIDDDVPTNFFNKKIITKHHDFKHAHVVYSGFEALKYLNAAQNNEEIKPDLIFLDINMPAMNGWDFLIEFSKLDKEFTKEIKVIMLTTSSSPDDLAQSSKNHAINGIINKPLSIDLLDNILANHF